MKPIDREESGTAGRRPGRRRRRALLLLGFLGSAWAFAADYVMKSGDTLYQLALDQYNDASYWQALKWYNGIQNVRTIPVGTEIDFPDRSVLDQVRSILDDGSTSSADKVDRIQALGGGRGRGTGGSLGRSSSGQIVNYNALDALGQRRVPGRD